MVIPPFSDLHRLRPRLIAEWRSAWRYWSIRIAAIGAALSGAWVALPADTRALIPGAQWIGLLLFGLTIAARLVDQPGARR